jgi:hypothetical protein
MDPLIVFRDERGRGDLGNMIPELRASLAMRNAAGSDMRRIDSIAVAFGECDVPRRNIWCLLSAPERKPSPRSTCHRTSVWRGTYVIVGSDASISAPAVATGVNSRGDCFGFFAPKLLGTSPRMIG